VQFAQSELIFFCFVLEWPKWKCQWDGNA